MFPIEHSIGNIFYVRQRSLGEHSELWIRSIDRNIDSNDLEVTKKSRQWGMMISTRMLQVVDGCWGRDNFSLEMFTGRLPMPW